MKRLAIAVLCMCMAVSMTGCGEKKQEKPQTNTESKEKTEEELAKEAKEAKLAMISPAAYDNVEGLDLEPGTYFSVIGRSGSKEYWKQVKAGAEAAVSDLNELLGYDGGDKIKVVYSAPSESDDVGEQVNILDEELSRYPASLAISVIDEQSCDVQFDLATQNGIPIVLFDSVNGYQGVMAKVRTDNMKAAREAATHMAEAAGDSGEVLVYVNDSKSTTAKERVEAFVAEIHENHPEMSVPHVYYKDDLEEVKTEMAEAELSGGTENVEDVTGEAQTTEASEATGETAFTPEELKAQIEAYTEEEVLDYILSMNTETKGIYTSNGPTALAMADACERAEIKDMPIIAFDGDQAEIEAIEEGKLYGVILQNPYGIGYATIVAQARSVLEIGNEAEINTGYTWVTAENCQSEEIQRLLYQK